MWRRYLRLLGSDPTGDVDDELAFHFQMRVDDLVRRGVPEAEARARAEREFGDVDRIRGELERIGRDRQKREARALGWESLTQDLRFALRTLTKSPGFTVVAVLTLALGIGASTGMFMLVNSVLLRPLPYGDAERLVMVWERPPNHPELDNEASPANFHDWREQATSFSSLVAWFDRQAALTGEGEPEEVLARYASPAWFETLGASARLGRTFGEGDRDAFVAVLSHRLWQRRYAADPAVVGRAITFNGQALTVIGVLPPDFRPVGREVPEVWVPFEPPEDARGRYLHVLGRLAPGTSVEQAASEMRAVAARLESASVYNEGYSADVVPLREQETGDVRPALLILLGAVALLLLIACGNLASLLLGRAAGRAREMAVRLSLGASKARLLRQTLTEAVVLGAAGGALGVLLATAGLDLLLRAEPAGFTLPRLHEVGLDARVVGFAVLVSLATAALFGAAPALAATRVELATTLRGGTRGSTAGHGGLRRGLVVVQVALAVILLAGAGLLGRSLLNLVETDVGMREERVLTLRLTLAGYRGGDALRGFVGQLLPRLRALPGVTAAGATSWLPLTSNKSTTAYAVAGRPTPRTGDEPTADVRMVTPGYHAALGIPVLRGRTFDARDHADAPQVFVVNQALVDRVFPDQDPIGQRLQVPWGRLREGEIVGVVGDVRESGPGEPAAPAMYWAWDQEPSGVVTIVLATPGDPRALVGPAVAAIHELDPAQPVGDIRPMDRVVEAAVARPRFYMALLGGFAAASLLLAGLGLFGVVSHSVAQRRRAIGVRIALGATPGRVTGLVVREGMALTALGLLVGIAAAAALTRLMRGLLYGVSPTDPLTAAVVALFLALVALVASWLPARRAARVDPVEAMRPE